jgi:hypothetical protein
MLDSKRLTLAVARLRSEKPAHWRDELESINSEKRPGLNRSHRLKHATVTEISALCVVLKEVGSLSNAEAEYSDRFWRRLALRRRLRIANDDCLGKPQNPACRCNGEAVDALTDAELVPLNLMEARARVLTLAKERHMRVPRPKRPRKLSPRADKPAPAREMPAGAAQSPPEPPQPSTETPEPPPSPQPRARPVRRTPKWFDEDERGSIIDRIF